jgi:hypothetical protein
MNARFDSWKANSVVLELRPEKKETQLIASRGLIGGWKLSIVVVVTFLCCGLGTAKAQSAAPSQTTVSPDDADRLPVRGTEIEVWSGGGANPLGSPGVTHGNAIWTAGLRYGWILSDAHGKGFLRGRFEYAVDAIPVFMVFQPGGHAYGFGFDPWIMRWNFETHRRISPYIELGGGGLITTREIPVGESRFNFTPTAAFGVNILRGKYHWSVDFRVVHISDAELTKFNPGTDTFGVRVGWGEYRNAK